MSRRRVSLFLSAAKPVSLLVVNSFLNGEMAWSTRARETQGASHRGILSLLFWCVVPCCASHAVWNSANRSQDLIRLNAAAE